MIKSRSIKSILFLSSFFLSGPVFSIELSTVKLSDDESKLTEAQVYERFYRGSFELRKRAAELREKNKAASDELLDQALVNYQKAILRLGERQEFMFQMGQTYMGQEKEQEALSAFKKSQGNDPELLAATKRKLEFLSKKYPEVAVPKEKMTEEQAYQKFYYPSFQLRGEKNYKSAIDNYKQLIALNFGDTNIFKQLALTQSSDGDLAGAISTLEEALAKWPDEKYNRYLYLFLAEFYEQNGDLEKSRQAYERANEFSLRVFKRPHVTAIKKLLAFKDQHFECPASPNFSSIDQVDLLNRTVAELNLKGDERSTTIAERLTDSFKGKAFNKDDVITRTPEVVTDEIYDMLKDIDGVFKEAGLNYMMAAGTLLGAVRHKGIIPWDDDGDLSAKEEDLTPAMLKKLRKAFQEKDMEIIEDEQCGFKIRRIGEYAPAIDLFTLKKDKNSDDLIYAKKHALDLFPREKYPVKAFSNPVRIPFGDFHMNAMSPEENQHYLDRAYRPDWDYLAYQQWDHIHDRPIPSVKVLLVDKTAPLTKAQREGSSSVEKVKKEKEKEKETPSALSPEPPPLNISYIDSFNKKNFSELTEENKDELRTLLRECFPGTVRNDIEHIFEHNLKDHKVSFLKDGGGHIMGSIIGYGTTDDQVGKHVFIDKVCVSPSQRGQGTGSRFLTDFMGKADTEKTKKFKLTVMKDNPKAKKLYERPPFSFKVSREYGSAYEMVKQEEPSQK